MERHDSLGGRPKFQFTDISQLGFALFTVLSPVYIYRYTTFLDFSYNCWVLVCYCEICSQSKTAITSQLLEFNHKFPGMQKDNHIVQ